MEKREFKDKVFSELARVGSALSNPKRLEIIDLLAQGEKTVENIAAQTGVPVANASQHLQVLKASCLVEIRKAGNFVYYRLANDQVTGIWKSLRELGISRSAAIEQVVSEFRAQKKIFESLTIADLLLRMSSENVILLDVRPADEYQSGHIANAVSIPSDQLASRLAELPDNYTIIAYCRGPFCVFADEAIELLRQHEFQAYRLDEGFTDWKLKGLPVAANN